MQSLTVQYTRSSSAPTRRHCPVVLAEAIIAPGGWDIPLRTQDQENRRARRAGAYSRVNLSVAILPSTSTEMTGDYTVSCSIVSWFCYECRTQPQQHDTHHDTHHEGPHPWF
jgi:hypothetical protein